MKIQILEVAKKDIIQAFHFYERQERGLGEHFLVNIYTDIDNLKALGGIHRIVYKKYHRALSKRFPFAIYYTLNSQIVRVYSVIHFKRSSDYILKKLKE